MVFINLCYYRLKHVFCFFLIHLEHAGTLKTKVFLLGNRIPLSSMSLEHGLGFEYSHAWLHSCLQWHHLENESKLTLLGPAHTFGPATVWLLVAFFFLHCRHKNCFYKPKMKHIFLWSECWAVMLFLCLLCPFRSCLQHAPWQCEDMSWDIWETEGQSHDVSDADSDRQEPALVCVQRCHHYRVPGQRSRLVNTSSVCLWGH